MKMVNTIHFFRWNISPLAAYNQLDRFENDVIYKLYDLVERYFISQLYSISFVYKVKHGAALFYERATEQTQEVRHNFNNLVLPISLNPED